MLLGTAAHRSAARGGRNFVEGRSAKQLNAPSGNSFRLGAQFGAGEQELHTAKARVGDSERCPQRGLSDDQASGGPIGQSVGGTMSET
jgi:hypothetical protein